MAGIKYQPTPAPADPAALGPYLQRELVRIADALNQHSADLVALDVQTAPPNNPPAGTIAHADGTSWNPGAGGGLYEYFGGAWNKL